MLPAGSFGENVEILLEMRLSKIGTAFHPSIPLALKADEYLDALDDWKYMESSKLFIAMISHGISCSWNLTIWNTRQKL